MSSREDFQRFRTLDIDCSSIGLEQGGDTPYFCTPVGAEYVGWIGCDGIHFILPGDERVFCVDPAMGEEGTYVLPVADDLREFLSFVLFCRDANPLSQIWWMEEPRFRQILAEDAAACREGDYLDRKKRALDAIARTFGLTPRDPYETVKALQMAFDPACLTFSDEYYEVLGLDREER